MDILGLKAGKGQEEPEYLVIPEWEEVIKDYSVCVKISQKPTWRASHWLDIEPFEHQKSEKSQWVKIY